MRPVIGVMPLFDEERNSIWMVPGYMEGIQEAGGLPVILSARMSEREIEQICDMCDGFLFTGGHDVDPALYGMEKSPYCSRPNEDRDILEKKIFAAALKEDRPVFGICRGIQLINVLCGGTLYQDLSVEYAGSKAVEHHMQPPYDVPCHRVEILENTPLYKLLQKPAMEVNSYHHQAIRILAPALAPMAVSEDGLIEAVYMPEQKFVQAVQWHPEFIYKKDRDCRKLFEAFTEACAE